MSNMDYEYNESEEFKQVILAKKEKFRTEIRKTKNKEEFAMKRIKLMQEYDNSRSQMSQSNQPNLREQKQQMYEPAENSQNEQKGEKESFFSQFDNNKEFIKQNNNNNNNKSNNVKETQDLQQNQSNYLDYQSHQNPNDNIQALLDEFKNQFRNGNRKILFDYLCSIRKRLTIASSEVERSYEYQKQYNKNYNRSGVGGNQNNAETTMSLANNYQHPVFSAITGDKQFLSIIQEILQITDYQQLNDIQNECMWILINICAGKNQECMLVLNMGILDTFKHLLENCNDLDILENVCWCLGNLAADDAECREKLFEDSSFIITVVQGFYEKVILKMLGFSTNNSLISSQQPTNPSSSNYPYNSSSPSQLQQQSVSIPSTSSLSQQQQQELIYQNNNSSRQSIISELVFFLTNLIKKHPMPRIDPLRKILQILKELFFLDIPLVKIQIVKSFWVLLMKSDAYLNEVLQLDIIRHIMPFLAGKNTILIKESIDLFTVIVTNCDEFTRKMFVDSKFQAYLEKAISNHSKEIKLKSIALLSKILECSEGLNISAEILYQERLVFKLLSLLVIEDFQIKASILSLFKEFLHSDMGVQKLLKHDYIQILIRLGKCGCPSIEKLVLLSLDLIFDYGTTIHDYENSTSYDTPENPIMQTFFQHTGESLLEQLQSSRSEEICQLCLQLMKKYIYD